MTVREFRREDTAQTAELWLRLFRGQERPAPQALRDYFQLVFFGAPRRDEALPSLVYEEHGRILGFLGVMPRQMRYRGTPVRVAVVTQIMADERARNRYAALALARRCLAGPQDLTLGDGSNESADRLWRGFGAEVARLYNLNWLRLLRPFQYLAALARERPGLAALARSFALACRAADAVLALGPGSLRLPAREDGLVAEDAAPAVLARGIGELSGDRSLTAADDPATLAWLLERATEKGIHGAPVRKLLRDRDGGIAGWYFFYARRGGIAQVLQVAARPGRMREVLHRLFREARQRGAVAVTGQLDPRHMTDFAAAGCRFAWPGYSVIAHSRRPELMAAIHRGDAWLTRLEGEWWARFSDPCWSALEPANSEGVPACAASQAS